MKNNFSLILFLIFYIFSFVITQNTESLLPAKNIQKNLNGNNIYLITLEEDISQYKEFIKIVLNSKSLLKPMMIISKDDNLNTQNRIYSSPQTSSNIYYFFKTKETFDESGKGSFYLHFIEQGESTDYNIMISNEEKPLLPIDEQTNYFVTENNKRMKFNLILNQDKLVDYINIWVKGQNIIDANINLNTLSKKKFEYGFVFYGEYTKTTDIEIDIEGQIGDFITIGSISFKENQSNELKENDKEITAVISSKNNEICFPIKFESDYPLHLTGKIYTRKALLYYKDDKKNKIEKSEYNITDGILSYLNFYGYLGFNYGTNGQFCLTHLDQNSNEELIIFSLQMTSNKKISIIHPPMIPGEIRRHFLEQGEIAAFYGLKPKETAKELNLNIKGLKGFPEMYFDECNNFPNCQYDINSLDGKINPFPSNRMTVYSTYFDEEKAEYKNYNPISNFQPIMLVYCAQGNKIYNVDQSAFCEFDTSYFTNEDRIHIYEGSSFSQYLLNDEIDQYKIDFQNENDIDKIYLDFIIFSGDIEVIFDTNFGNNIHKYYLSNKIYYSITITSENKNNEILFEVKAHINSFYMVQYQIVKTNIDSKYTNKIESGINFISSIDISSNKEVVEPKKFLELINFKSEYEVPYLITLSSQNCKFNSYLNIPEGINPISSYDNTAQIIIEGNEAYYMDNPYNIDIAVTTRDKTKVYMVNVAGLELSESYEKWNGRAISLTEGVPHIFTYTKNHRFISYAYHINNYANGLIINLNLIDQGNFEVFINVERKLLKKLNISKDSNIYIEPPEFLGKCEDMEVCTIIVSINANNIDVNKRTEISMNQLHRTPTYLEKNAIKKDIIHGNIVNRYYFEIYDGEFGDITLNFERGSGNIFAYIQERNLKTPMEFPEWRGIYQFPKTSEDSLKYDSYNKKIIIDKSDTEKCVQGCYVLISVENNIFFDENYIDDFTPYRISLNPRIVLLMNDNTQVNSVRMKLNEYIIGDINLLMSKYTKYDYYEITLPYDSEYIYIDWQGDDPSFLINIGNIQPTLDNKESYQIKNDHTGDYVYKYKKEDILNKLNPKPDSLKGLVLTLGIYSEGLDSMNSSPYAFKIFMPPKDVPNNIDLIHIRTDQKVQCLPFNYKNKYICYFAVIFDEMDINSNLIIYPRSKKGEDFIIYGEYLDAGDSENNNMIINTFLDAIFENNVYKIDTKYIYKNNIPSDKSYLFITVMEKSDIIEVLSSTYYYYENMIFYPNPSSPQVFALGNRNIKLNFGNIQDIQIDIESISKEGYFKWNTTTENENNNYYLNGYEDRLSLTMFLNKEETKSSSLNVDVSNLITKQDDTSGFIFYINYSPKNSNFTIDKIKQGRTTKFNYYKTDNMPLYYYTEINSSHSWIIYFNFDYYGLKDNEIISYDNEFINFWSIVTNEEEALKSKYNSNMRPKYDKNKCIQGVFGLDYGSLLLSNKDIEKFNIKENPIVYFSLEKPENNPFNLINMSLDISLYSDEEKEIQENKYIPGKISNDKKRFVYWLKNDKNNSFIIIEFSANSINMECIVSNDINSEFNGNFKQLTKENINGRIILKVELYPNDLEKKLYLIMFTTKNIDSKTGNYIFKYFTSKELPLNNFPYSQQNSNITFKKEKISDKINYEISFEPIKEKDVTYYIKAIYKNGRIREEIMDSIAISESLGRNMIIKNPSYEDNKNLSFTLENIKEDINYIKVTAKVNKDNQKIFLSYYPALVSEIKYDETDNSSNDDDDKTGIYIVIGIVSFIFIVALTLGIIVFWYRHKNKDLLQKVNKISFVGNNDDNDGKDDNLLIKENYDENMEIN